MNASLAKSRQDCDEPAIVLYGWRERLKFWAGSLLGYWVMRILGSTLRWRVEGLEHLERVHAEGRRAIMVFWHGRIIFATYYFRHRGIVVMTSRNKDGEYIARVIRRLGYGTARGSSSRGGRRALVEMIRAAREGHDLGFTIDGPRGPRYVAKPGAVWIAAKTGQPVCPFHLSPERAWVLHSWDLFHVPVPFTRVLLKVAEPIYVPADANESELAVFQSSVQRSLDHLREHGDSYWTRQETARAKPIA